MSSLQHQHTITHANSHHLGHERGYFGCNVAFYTLINIKKSELDSIITAAKVDSEDDEIPAKPAPRYDFAGKNLQAIVDAHVRLAQQTTAEGSEPEFHPLHFVVVTSGDWETNGVLLVCINIDEEGTVDAYYCRVEDSAGGVVLIELGESSWDEKKGEAQDFLPQVEQVCQYTYRDS